MTAKLADRVKETSTSTGSGTINLDGAVSGFQTFVAGIGSGNSCYYCIAGGTEWEVGIGTVTDATPDTLSRTTILASSNAGSLVSLSAGTKDVFVTVPASQGPLFDLTPPPPDVSAITTTQGNNGGSITSGASSVVVSSASGFPSSGAYLISIDSEHMKVTAGQGTTTWTVTRGYGGTSAASHTDGATITLINWEWLNQGGASTTQTARGIRLIIPNAASNNLRIRKRLMASYTAVEAAFLPEVTGATNTLRAGIMLRESATGKMVTFAVTSSSSGPVIYIEQWNNSYTTTSATPTTALPFFPGCPVFFRMEPTTSTMLFLVSADGESFNNIQSGGLAKTTAFTTAADEWGFFGNSANSSYLAVNTLVSWKEIA